MNATGPASLATAAIIRFLGTTCSDFLMGNASSGLTIRQREEGWRRYFEGVLVGAHVANNQLERCGSTMKIKIAVTTDGGFGGGR
jgi:hypothetical protein